MRKWIRIGAALAAVNAALAVDLPVVADTSLGALQGGALPNLTTTAGSRVLLRFAVGVLPLTVSPSQVMKATLLFHVNRVGAAGPMQVSQLLGPFEETAVLAANAPGAGTVLATMNPAMGWNAVDVTALVQQWVTSPGTAYGVDLTVPAGSATQVLVDSKENAQTSHPAVVRIVLNGPAGAAGATGAVGPQGPMGPAETGADIVLAGLCNLHRRKGLAMPAGITCPVKVAFVTVGQFNGNMGGLAGADAQCQSEAAQAGLSGTFRAWLSTSGVSAASRLSHSLAPYQRRDGLPVAFDWADLTDGTIANAINVTASGAPVSPTSGVWTGTLASGAAAANSCNNWTDASFSLGGGTGMAFTGLVWTENGVASCSTFRRLYCLEQ